MAKGKVCFNCIRKTECYTELGLKELVKPNKTVEDLTGYECGAIFTNYEEAREFIFIIGEAINSQSRQVQNSIYQFIADKYKLDIYNVMIEFDRILQNKES